MRKMPIAKVLRRISELNGRIEASLAESPPDLSAAQQAQRELARLERRRNRLWLERTTAAGQAPVRGLPLRDQVANVLNELQVPASPSLISQYHHARFGQRLPLRRLSSLKRDEARSWRSGPNQRPFYIVSALEASRLHSVRGLLALSTFEPPLRFIGPLSPRVDYLRVVGRICTQAAQAAQAAPESSRQALTQLLWQLASKLTPLSDSEEEAWIQEVKTIADAELTRFEEEDRKDRHRAAERAMTLSDDQRLFGAPPLSAIEGGAS